MSTLDNPIHSAFEAAERVLASRLIWIIVAASLLAFQMFLIWDHKPWADELQAQMIALEAPDHATLLAWLRYEGHPPLWYWLLRALGNLAEPQIVLPLAATLCAGITQGAILFASPFARFERLLIASSQYILFEFLTIARGTSLGVALIALALVLWRSRWFWLIMALLPLVDFLFGVLSGVLLVLKWQERNLWWPGIALWLAGSGFAAWTVIPPADMVNAIDAMQPLQGKELLLHNAYGWLLKIGSIPLPFPGGILAQWKAPVVPIAGIAWVLFLALCWILTRGRPWHMLVMFGFLAFTLAFNLAVYSIGLRHMLLAALLLIALVWLSRAAGEQPNAVFRVWIAVAAICGIASASISAQRGFDSADKVLAEIEARGLSDKHWMALPEWRVPAVSGRSDLVFTRPEKNCRFRFVRWDHQSEALRSKEAFAAMLEQAVSDHGRSYLISDLELIGFDAALVEKVKSVPAGYDGVPYHLYVIGPQAPETSVNLPYCYDL